LFDAPPRRSLSGGALDPGRLLRFEGRQGRDQLGQARFVARQPHVELDDLGASGVQIKADLAPVTLAPLRGVCQVGLAALVTVDGPFTGRPGVPGRDLGRPCLG
jgi:hypothetical protein